MPRGKKICPECDRVAGARLGTCPCGHVFRVKKPKPKVMIPTEDSPTTEIEKVRLKDPQALRKFLGQLRECARSSLTNGGLYSAFLHHDTGCVEVQVWLSKGNG